MRISMSDINAFLACRQKWAWGSVGNLERLDTSAALSLGTGIHYALEQFYRPDAPDVRLMTHFQDWEARQLETTGQFPLDDKSSALGQGMLNEYEAEYGLVLPGHERDFTVLTTEQEFIVRIPFTEDGWLIGTMDGLVRRHADDTIWVIDHKTAATFPRRDTLCLNSQFLGYAWAANKIAQAGLLEARYGLANVRVSGVLYNGLRKQKKTANVTAPLFMREWVEHRSPALADFGMRLLDIYRDMQMDPVYPAPGQHCDWCEFQNPCVARQMGEDHKWLLDNAYRVKPARGVVYADEFKVE